MFWGIFDILFIKNISWESHLMGFILDFFLIYLFKSKLAHKKIEFKWEDEENDDDDDNNQI